MERKHGTYSSFGLYDFVSKSDENLDTPSGSSRVYRGYGKLDVEFLLDAGKRVRCTLHDVGVVPEVGTNLFSLDWAAD